ncbi:MAG: B12-binding domain-containing radical SAM protein [Bacteroidetes bacterium]|nr:B12-binding domain-containing radical SAM protein [Bacteroidota bacterium]MBU1718406.1 B12-binding domain-containing radical SAM protein [Bacteroidota bacterium]
MKILLVAPCPPLEQRHNTMNVPQLTLSLIAGMTPPEHEVEIVEEVFGDTIDFDGDYDVIGITLMTQTAFRGYQVANEFKKRGKIVVFGGIHATCRPEEVIQYGDAAVIGEAENGLWESVLDDIKQKRLKPFYKLAHFPDLQKTVKPRRDLINLRSGKFSVSPIETTRGCPYNCDFCTVSRFFGVKQRHKKIRDIVEEAEACDGKFLFFLDDNITIDKQFAKELFRELIPLRKTWVGQASISLSKDKELMQLAHKSGGKAVLVGFESMTAQGLTQYRKGLKTIKENVDAVKRLRDHGLMTMASLVFGLDTDDDSVFDVSFEFLTRSKSAFFQSCMLTPYPGTPVFEGLKEQGRILTDDWSRYDATKVLIEPKNMTPEQLLKGANEIQKAIFSNNSILKRSLPNVSLGLTEFIFYFTLNKGFQKRFEQKLLLGVQRNKNGEPVDFDASKYVVPFKQKIKKQEYVPECAIC